jgi:hypothetical protein
MVAPPDHSEVDAVISYVGGLRWTGGNVTIPLAKLELGDIGIRVSPSIRALSGIVPEWEIPWGRVERAEAVRALRVSGGVRLYVTPDTRFIFWHRKPAKVLDGLASREVPVDYSEHRMGLFGT